MSFLIDKKKLKHTQPVSILTLADFHVECHMERKLLNVGKETSTD